MRWGALILLLACNDGVEVPIERHRTRRLCGAEVGRSYA